MKFFRCLSAKSETAAAIRHALSRWRVFTRFINDGRLEIDNSAAERALRAVALGGKNFLFADSDAGGERAAALYSLIGSATKPLHLVSGLQPTGAKFAPNSFEKVRQIILKTTVLGNERATYGEQIVATLSRQLVGEFGRGFKKRTSGE